MKRKSNLKISVVMPNFNGVNFLERAIKSVVEQSYQNIELIIKDGGSEDGSLEVIKHYAKKYPKKIKWITGKDKGQSDAVNIGIKKATGDLIGWLNCDDVYKKDALKLIADYFEKNPKVMWAFGKCDIIDGDDKQIRSLITSYKNFWLKRYNYKVLLVLNFISQMGVFWRKEINEKLGSLDEKQYYVMDYNYWLRLGKSYDPGFIDEYIASFRITPNTKSSNGYAKQFKDELEVSKKYTDSEAIIFLHRVHAKLITFTYSGFGLINKFNS